MPLPCSTPGISHSLERGCLVPSLVPSRQKPSRDWEAMNRAFVGYWRSQQHGRSHKGDLGDYYSRTRQTDHGSESQGVDTMISKKGRWDSSSIRGAVARSTPREFHPPPSYLSHVTMGAPFSKVRHRIWHDIARGLLWKIATLCDGMSKVEEHRQDQRQ